MIKGHTATWCHTSGHEQDPGVGCFSTMTVVGGVSTWMVDDVQGEGVIVLARNGRLNAQDLHALIDQLQQYEGLLRQHAA